MVKTSIVAHSNNLNVPIPANYIGKELEVLVYAKEEVEMAKKAPRKTAASFKGALTKKEGEEYLKYLKKARSEWERDI